MKVEVAPPCGLPDLNKLYDLRGRKVINIDLVEDFRAQELCESRGRRPVGPLTLISFMISVDVK